MCTRDIPLHLRTSKAKPDTGLGLTCIDFAHEQQHTFVIGTESGAVLKGSLNAGEISMEAGSLVNFVFANHSGPVYAVACSPFHRNLFLSVSTDMRIHVSSFLQSQPLLVLEPQAGYLFDVQWSPTRPLVFAVAAANGTVLIYDLLTSNAARITVLTVNNCGAPVHALQFSSRCGWLGAVDARGDMRIWALGTALTEQRPNEVAVLNQLATSSAVGEE